MSEPKTKKPIDWEKYPIRYCLWLNHCRLCGKNIANGQKYYDGGYRRRAHYECVEQEKRGSACQELSRDFLEDVKGFES